MPTGVCSHSAHEHVDRARNERGVGGVADDRRQHAVDVETDEQRPGEGGAVGRQGGGIGERHRQRHGWGTSSTSKKRSAQPCTSLRATVSRSARMRAVRSPWRISTAVMDRVAQRLRRRGD